MAICFAISAHTCPECLEDLLANVRHFCPGSVPVVYNGSGDPSLFEGISAPVCPYSRKMYWGRLDWCVLETMMWVVQEGLDFDFFVTLDSDALFIQHGYESLLERELSQSEYMAVDFRSVHHPSMPWVPGQTAWQEWDRWKPLLGVPHPYGAFAVAQAFRRSLVERIVTHPHLEHIVAAMRDSRIFALEEVLFPTLAVALGGGPKRYPPIYSFSVVFRRGSPFTLGEAQALRKVPDCHLLHPVERDMQDPVRTWIGGIAGYGKTPG
ncbi:MAG TPA: hypothetical protein VIK73_07210 [Limnochordales bacterium]